MANTNKAFKCESVQWDTRTRKVVFQRGDRASITLYGLTHEEMPQYRPGHYYDLLLEDVDGPKVAEAADNVPDLDIYDGEDDYEVEDEADDEG